ncbi:GPI mannosyltransferase 2 [Globomyces pollinis-pini]|nr:GPI mannosyltransferase 2 [Globomyces pollinis-pini]
MDFVFLFLLMSIVRHAIIPAITSRLFTITIALLSGHILLDYDQSTLLHTTQTNIIQSTILNQIHPSFQNQPLVSTNSVCSSTADSYIVHFLRPLVRWDAVYFLDIAKSGYRLENQHAFFPALPLLMRFVRLLFDPNHTMCHEAANTVAGLMISNVAFVLAATALFRLSKQLSFRPNTSRLAVTIWCLIPSSIFLSSIYTESLFAFFTFQGMLSYSRGNRFQASIWWSFSALTRSNGIIYIGFFIWDILHHAKKWQSSFVFLVMRSILYSGLVLLPFVGFQWYGYQMFCVSSVTTRPWCSQTIPMLYSFVQDYYWNCGFLKYYTLQQLPLFFLAFPVFFIQFYTIWHYFKSDPKRFMTLGFLTDSKNSQLEFGQSKLLPFIYLSLFMVFYCGLFMHVQVVLRFMTSQPIVYWFIASRLNQKSVPSIVKVYLYYCVVYGSIGAVLFGTFLPPA